MTMSRSSRIISLFTKQASEPESGRIEPNGAPEGSWAVMTGREVGKPSAWGMKKPVVADRSLVGSVAVVAESVRMPRIRCVGAGGEELRE